MEACKKYSKDGEGLSGVETAKMKSFILKNYSGQVKIFTRLQMCKLLQPKLESGEIKIENSNLLISNPKSPQKKSPQKKSPQKKSPQKNISVPINKPTKKSTSRKYTKASIPVKITKTTESTKIRKTNINGLNIKLNLTDFKAYKKLQDFLDLYVVTTALNSETLNSQGIEFGKELKITTNDDDGRMINRMIFNYLKDVFDENKLEYNYDVISYDGARKQQPSGNNIAIYITKKYKYKKDNYGYIIPMGKAQPLIVEPNTPSITISKDFDVTLAILNNLLKDYQLDFDIKKYTENMVKCEIPEIIRILKNAILLSYAREGTEEYHIYEEDLLKAIENSKSKCAQIKKSEFGGINWEDVVGHEDIKRELDLSILQRVKNRELFKELDLPKASGIILYGPPGTGKTTLAKAIASEASLEFIYVQVSDIFGSLMGESEKAVKEIFQEARDKAPSIIFIDEIDSLFSSRSSGSRTNKHETHRNVTNLFLSEMDGINTNSLVFMIGATNMLENVDPAFLRPGRFDKKIMVGLPTDENKKKQLELGIKKISSKHINSIDVDYDEIVELTNGFTPADITGILDRLKEEIASHIILENRGMDITTEDLKIIIEEVRKEFHSRTVSLTRGSAVLPEIPKVYLNDIGGYENVKQLIRSTFIYPIQHADVYEKLGIKEYPGMVLYGPSGTGKTTFAKAIATESGLNFIQVRPSDVISSLTGESAKKVSKIFEMARASKPSLLYFDEMEALFSDRLAKSNQGNDIINQLLIEIDGVDSGGGVYLLGSTNLLGKLDPAVIRPGRFGLKIEIGLPDDDDRKDIIEYYINKTREDSGITFSGSVDEVVELTDKMSGAEIKEIFRLLKAKVARVEIEEGKVFKEIDSLEEEIEQVKATWKPEEKIDNPMYL
jgi:transitional endoplasmic reticulum ATPase